MALLLLPDDQTGLVVGRVRVRDRVAAFLHAVDLDRELARGASPDASGPIALRARAVVRPSARATLGKQLLRIVRDAQAGPSAFRMRVPLRRSEIVAAAGELESLAHRLLSPGPAGLAGLARARLLIADPRSPLYWNGSAGELRAAAEQAASGLEGRLG